MFRNHTVCAVLLVLFAAAPAWAASQTFQAELDPAPFDAP
jgi:hypothetical protein